MPESRQPNVVLICTDQWRGDIHGEHNVHFAGIGSMHYIVERDWKYVWHSGTGREQLFDLANDPDECVDLAISDSPPAALERLRARLIEELTGREEGFVDEGKLIAGRPVKKLIEGA
jgi:arylsulfatase